MVVSSGGADDRRNSSKWFLDPKKTGFPASREGWAGRTEEGRFGWNEEEGFEVWAWVNDGWSKITTPTGTEGVGGGAEGGW